MGFDQLRTSIEKQRGQSRGQNAHEEEMLAQAVEQKVITQADEADAFNGIHERLGNSGLMP